MKLTDLALVSEKCGVMSTLRPSKDKSFFILFYYFLCSKSNPGHFTQVHISIVKKKTY